MRANEFVIEGKRRVGKLSKRAEQASKGVYKTRDVGGYDRTYHMNRMGMAMAMADGKSTDKVDMDAASWIEKYNTIHPYTKEEDNMIQAAMKTIPTDHHHQVSDHRSLELDSTNKVSPMKGFKGYGK
jgi:hypothetical protein